MKSLTQCRYPNDPEYTVESEVLTMQLWKWVTIIRIVLINVASTLLEKTFESVSRMYFAIALWDMAIVQNPFAQSSNPNSNSVEQASSFTCGHYGLN